ncbi:hypothetical protein [Burkholderia sp. S171]|uniref:hypothetical protein n=1 Tax=Burkholderia sp. S171 TaxID=1641860 RepID=UPI00131C7BB0|nr:hypothetical protein [Burkholderia sp. S171]
MESTGCVVKQENTATAHKIAVISAVWFVLGSSTENVCAQNTANDDRVIQLTSAPVVSEYETFATRPNPPDIFMERKIGSADAGEGASNERIIVNPVMERALPASIQPIASAPAVRAGTALEKVTATTEESPATVHTTSVTLWDEIKPPLPAPIPVDAASRSAPGDVASAGAQRTQ